MQDTEEAAMAQTYAGLTTKLARAANGVGTPLPS